MSLVLYHHPLSRAATVVWMLEELGEPYELSFVDLMSGAHQTDDHVARNRMAKIPVLQDGETHVSEASAIGVYLADRYASGRLAPTLDDPTRGLYLRWCFFAPSVIEPACMAKSAGWEYSPQSAGFGTYENMIATLSEGVAKGPWLLGDTFTMADVIVGATVRFMLRFNMMERNDEIGAYIDRLEERPALKATDAKNAEVAAAHGIKRG